MRNLIILSGLAITLTLAGCGSGESSSDGDNYAVAAKGASQQGVLVILAKADEVDGTSDKVVSKCMLCAFNMDGSAEHASELNGYTVHLCSEHCKEAFDSDPTGMVEMAKLPQS